MIFSSCRTSLEISQDEVENPCKDLNYQELKKKNVRDMNKTEVEEFKQRDRECREYLKVEKQKATNNLIYILSGLGVLLVIAFVLGMAASNWH